VSLQRLSIETLRAPGFPGGRVIVPGVDPRVTTIGIVHFGIGAFHRGHQAVFTEDAAAATGETGWGIFGVTGRTDAVVQQMRPQDCLYGVLNRGAAATTLRLIASVRDVAWPGRDSERVAEMLASPTTHIATLTITEKGYLRAPGGAVDLDLPAVQHDLAVIERELAGEGDLPMSHTPIGLLVRGLARRFRRSGAPFTVVSCDNLVGNGAITQTLVISLVAAIRSAWLDASVTFPSTMVDRITPATTEADREEAFALLGAWDEALVVVEPFTQWVIEDRFAGPRPAWEKAGAILTDNVTPYERVKLRILNATHSLLAYTGALKGYRTIAEALDDTSLRQIAQRVIDDDILPTLEAPAGVDLAQYRDSVLERFANPNIAHTTLQVAMDGSQKLPNRVLGTVVDRLEVGQVPTGLAFMLAAWIVFVASTMVAGGPALDDPLAAVLHEALGSPDAIVTEPEAVVARFFAIEAVFPPEVRASDELLRSVSGQLAAALALVRT
jgi:fructuronate reductase